MRETVAEFLARGGKIKKIRTREQLAARGEMQIPLLRLLYRLNIKSARNVNPIPWAYSTKEERILDYANTDSSRILSIWG